MPAALAMQSPHGSGLDIGACLGVENTGKLSAGRPHARFDKGGHARAALYSTRLFIGPFVTVPQYYEVHLVSAVFDSMAVFARALAL